MGNAPIYSPPRWTLSKPSLLQLTSADGGLSEAPAVSPDSAGDPPRGVKLRPWWVPDVIGDGARKAYLQTLFHEL